MSSKPPSGAPSEAIDLGALEIGVSDYVSQGNAILGIRDSGKSYTATYLAEQLLCREIPFIAFDPIGVWRFLRYGKRRWHVLIAGGESADIPLTPGNSVEIVRHAMKENIPLILDLYQMSLSKADWRRIVQQSIEVLLYENKDHGPRHIFIEEAAEFVPQIVRAEHAHVYSEIEKLARMGGNAMLGYTLINQRAEQLNKAVLELCDCLFLHRQKGRLSLTALQKWLDFGDPRAATPVIKSLPMLEQGKCWVWAGGSERPIQTKIPAKQSFHPNRRTKTDAGEKVAVPQMIPDLTKPAPAKKVAGFQGRAAAAPAAEPKVVHLPVFEDGALIRLETYKRELQNIAGDLETKIAGLHKIVRDVNETLQRCDRLVNPPKTYVPPPRKRDENGAATPLAKGPQKILNVLASKYPGRLTFSQIGTLTGFTGSTLRTYFPGLRAAGKIDENSDGITIDEDALMEISTIEAFPSGGQPLVDFWKSKLGQGEGAILQVLFENRPHSVSTDFLSKETGYTDSTLRTYIPTLRRNGLIHANELRISRDFL